MLLGWLLLAVVKSVVVVMRYVSHLKMEVLSFAFGFVNNKKTCFLIKKLGKKHFTISLKNAMFT